MTRGTLPFGEHIDARRLAERLVDALQHVHARTVIATADRVSFTGGPFRLVSGWNVLVPFSRGELTIDEGAKLLQYKVSFRQLVLILVVCSVLALVFMVAWRLPLAMIPVALAVIWLWIGGMNVLIGRARFERFLRRAIDAAAIPARGVIERR